MDHLHSLSMPPSELMPALPYVLSKVLVSAAYLTQ